MNAETLYTFSLLTDTTCHPFRDGIPAMVDLLSWSQSFVKGGNRNMLKQKKLHQKKLQDN